MPSLQLYLSTFLPTSPSSQNRHPQTPREKMPFFAAVLNRPITSCSVAALLLSLSLLLSSFLLGRGPDRPLPSPRPPAAPSDVLSTLLHYATSPLLPQQSRAEISLSLRALRRRSPCRLLVFGLGHDSPMWAAFNPGGATLFLEEDPRWLRSVLRAFPSLAAHAVRYPTRLSEADALLRGYRAQPACLPPLARLRGNRQCRLALADLPAEVYETEWDVIMIDAPRGFFAEAPGRMGAIYSAAVMARARRGEGATDVFLHDVERPVEKAYATEFLCRKYLVGGVGRLWHFRIPPARENSTSSSSSSKGEFC